MHTSPNRDDYIKINKKNILNAAKKNFMKYNSSFVSNFGIGYDYWSIMHYSTEAFSVDPDRLKTIVPLQKNIYGLGQRERMSEGDVYRLNLVYKCVNCSPRLNLSLLIVLFLTINYCVKFI